MQPSGAKFVLSGMKQTFSKLALCATLGLAIAGCQGNQASSAASTAVTASPVAAGATASPTSTGASRPGVIANCTNPLSSEPSSIMLTCADAGVGVQDLTWTSWTASSAAGQGLLWENTCVPDCAEANLAHYPVGVTLSAVKASAKGPWFSRLTITWEGSRPHNQTPDTFTLMPPG
jgi:hypothetical protein